MRLSAADTLEIIDRCLKVNGKAFVVTYPDEPICSIEDGKLVTLVFRGGCGCTLTPWEPEEVEGYFM